MTFQARQKKGVISLTFGQNCKVYTCIKQRASCLHGKNLLLSEGWDVLQEAPFLYCPESVAMPAVMLPVTGFLYDSVTCHNDAKS